MVCCTVYPFPNVILLFHGSEPLWMDIRALTVSIDFVFGAILFRPVHRHKHTHRERERLAFVEYKQFYMLSMYFMCCALFSPFEFWFHAVRWSENKKCNPHELAAEKKESIRLPPLHLFFIKDQIKTNKKEEEKHQTKCGSCFFLLYFVWFPLSIPALGAHTQCIQWIESL